ncbi:MAG: hypothetical protein QOF76_2129 [Solirubrobacteraceae bacterium]|jgi:pimeloyl-ACP methyl ester carboxylesterase|nr:hypothetical protein [Solirubrobacteraceae bacterium]
MRVLAVTLGLVLACAAPAGATTYAPLDAPGPKLSIPKDKLRAALKCSSGVDRSIAREPVLMLPGTTISPEANFSWNWFRALAANHMPYCYVISPGDTMADAQQNGEYVVYAIRRLHRRTGRKVQIVGHSQGGMIARWALRFWPGTRALVDDVIGLAPSNHGTIDARALCGNGCAPAIWQQRDDSQFTAALNSLTETFAGISYTSAYSRLDEVVIPNGDNETGSSALRTGDGLRSNVATQDICPDNLAEHLAIGTYDPVGYAIAMDALTHAGPADPTRIDPAVCSQTLMPGVDPATFVTDYGAAGAYLANVLLTYPHVPEEPPLACYVTATCPRDHGARPRDRRARRAAARLGRRVGRRS